MPQGKTFRSRNMKALLQTKKFSKLCLLEIIEQVHGDDKVIWDLGHLWVWEKEILSIYVIQKNVMKKFEHYL